MITSEKTIQLKNGAACILRSPTMDDAAAILQQIKTVFGETEYLSREPDEVTLTLEDEEQYLSEMLLHATDFNILAMVGGEIAGNLSVRAKSPYRKMKHRAGLGISVLEAYWHCGIATALLREGIAQARENGFAQIELEVFAENTRAMALYERFGFEVWGNVRQAGRFSDGSYHDEYVMGLLL